MNTETELNVAIADKLGRKWHRPTEEEFKSGSYYQYAPDYFRDANTRGEMLAVMTKEEKFELINKQSDGMNYEDVGDHLVGILELPQPQFAFLFARVMGIKEGV
jgi:hypothetical protein